MSGWELVSGPDDDAPDDAPYNVLGRATISVDGSSPVEFREWGPGLHAGVFVVNDGTGTGGMLGISQAELIELASERTAAGRMRLLEQWCDEGRGL